MATLLLPPGQPFTGATAALDAASRALNDGNAAAPSTEDLAGALCAQLGGAGEFQLTSAPSVEIAGAALPVSRLARLASTQRLVTSPSLPKTFATALLSTLQPPEWRAYFRAHPALLTVPLRALGDGDQAHHDAMRYRRAAVHRRLRSLAGSSLDRLGFPGGVQGEQGPPGAATLGVTMESSLHELAVPCVTSVKALRLGAAVTEQVPVACHFSGLALQPEDTEVPQAADAVTAAELQARRRAQVISAALRGALASLALQGNDVAVITDCGQAGVNPVELLRVLAPLLRTTAGTRNTYGINAVVVEFPAGAEGLPASAAGQLLPVPLLVLGPGQVVPCVEHLTAAGSDVSVGVVALGCTPAATLFHDLEWEAAARPQPRGSWLPYAAAATTARLLRPDAAAAFAEDMAERRDRDGDVVAAALFGALSIDAVADATDSVSVDADGRSIVAQRDGGWAPVRVPATLLDVERGPSPAPSPGRDRDAAASHGI